MGKDNGHHLQQWVDMENGLVSREIFVDETIYQQEQEQVFARSWLFIGHESQIPNPGDYFTSFMGEEAVILTRDQQHQIHVFLNTCTHRGMKVCRYDEGNTTVFTCPYHGWSFACDGKTRRRSPLQSGLSGGTRPLAVGLDRGGSDGQLQGVDLGHVGSRRAALDDLSGRYEAVSRYPARLP